jgi:hypothetical protein
MTELLVLSDPSDVFRPGDAYAESDVAFWLREGELAEGLRFQRGADTCEVRDGRLVTLYGESRGMPTHQRQRTDMGARLLRLLYERADAGEAPPTYREMQAELGVASRGAIAWQLAMLERDGYVIRERYAWRSVWITEAGVSRVKEVKK